MRRFHIIFLVIYSILLTGCAGPLMFKAKNQQLPSLSAEKSRVIFMRSTFHGHLYAAGIYEVIKGEPKFLAAVDNKNKFYFDMEAGEHIFLSTGTASMRFLKGSFAAGKTYYVVVRPRGWPGISFELSPVRNNGKGVFNLNSSEFNEIMANSDFMEMSPAAQKWAADREKGMLKEYAEEWPLWNSQSVDFKAGFTIQPEEGI